MRRGSALARAGSTVAVLVMLAVCSCTAGEDGSRKVPTPTEPTPSSSPVHIDPPDSETAVDVLCWGRNHQRGCRALRRHLHVSYRVWSDSTDTGTVWWIELSYDNDLDRDIWAGLQGRVRATGLLGDDQVWTPEGPRRAGTLSWGGSSADIAIIPPGRSQQLVAPTADAYVHTTIDGMFKVTLFEVGLIQPRDPS